MRTERVWSGHVLRSLGPEHASEELEGAGLEPIGSVGEAFDPQKHDAIEEIESDKPSGTIVEEAQRGYLYNGQVLRPARVKVAK